MIKLQKSDLQSFISKYYLNGSTEAVKWKISDESFSTTFMTADKQLIGRLSTEKISADHDMDLGVYNTANLLKIMTALKGDINMTIQEIGDKAVSIHLSDDNVNSSYMLADLQVIQSVPELSRTPDWDVTIQVNSEFVETFIKAKNALPDSENFVVQRKDNITKVIVNYSTISTNRIEFEVDGSEGPDIEPIGFSANLFKEVLVANKPSGDNTFELKVSGQGLAQITFDRADSLECLADYYLVKMQIG